MGSGDIQEYIASNSVILASSNIDEVYEKCLIWCRNKGMKVIESEKPFLITAQGIFNTFGERGLYFYDVWEISIQLSQDRKGMQINFSLLKVLNPSFKPRKNQPRYIISPYPRVVRRLYRYLGVHMSDDVLRDLYPREYLNRYISKFSMYLGFCILATAILVGYGWYREYISLIRGDILRFFLFSIVPFFSGLMVFDEWFVLRSLRERLYISL